RPIPPPGHVLGTAAVRLRPSGVVHLAARRVRRNQAVVDAFEQSRGGPHPILRISCEPTDEVAVVITASGIQGAASALLGRAHFPPARPTGTGAFAAMLTERDYTEDVRHPRHENRGCAPFTPGSARSQHAPAQNFFPQTKNYFFEKSKTHGR